MQISRPVRKHASRARRERIVQSYRTTQLTQRDFAAQAGISVSTLHKWLQQAASAQPTAKPRFIALPGVVAAPMAGPTYRLVFPSGVALEVRAGFTEQELATWLQWLPIA
jgi:hypothetical protein